MSSGERVPAESRAVEFRPVRYIASQQAEEMEFQKIVDTNQTILRHMSMSRYVKVMTWDNPFPVIGLAAVLTAFVGGITTMHSPHVTYRYMQARVYAQAFTFGSILIGRPIWHAIRYKIFPEDFMKEKPTQQNQQF